MNLVGASPTFMQISALHLEALRNALPDKETYKIYIESYVSTDEILSTVKRGEWEQVE